MLTPPSRHSKVMRQNVVERKADAEALREQNFNERLAADRANALGNRRQQICAAHRERDAFLLRVRALFEMSSRHPTSPAQLPGPLQRVPLKTKTPCGPCGNADGKRCGTGEKAQAALWSEVSTAAPSTEADDEISLKRCEEVPDPGPRLGHHARAASYGPKDSSLKELEVALTREVFSTKHELKERVQKCSVEAEARQEEHDVLDETLSSSDESIFEFLAEKQNAPATSSTAKNDGSTAAKVQSSTKQNSMSRSERAGVPGFVLIGFLLGLPKWLRDERALQKSLLRMDFEDRLPEASLIDLASKAALGAKHVTLLMLRGVSCRPGLDPALLLDGRTADKDAGELKRRQALAASLISTATFGASNVIQSFLLQALVQTAVQFADANCAIFEPELGEHKLVYTQLHNDFKQLFEDIMCERKRELEAQHVLLAVCDMIDVEIFHSRLHDVSFFVLCHGFGVRQASGLLPETPAGIFGYAGTTLQPLYFQKWR
eukprot:Skav230406  [mRNA]  locus=scaffold4006:23499:31022:+ [translate_table: standard]